MKEDRSGLSEIVYKGISVEKSDQKLLKVDGVEEKGINNCWFLYVSAIVANLCVFGVASGFSWTSPALQILTSNDSSINPLGIPATPVQESWIASLYSLGAAVGPLIGGKLSDTIGRKNTLLAVAVPKLICLLTICFASNVKIFYACRFIMGLVLGTVFAVMPLYLNEISEVHNRGTVLTMMGFFMNSGALYCLLLGPFVSIKILTFLCALPMFVFIIIFSLFMVETPSFLISTGKTNQAVKALKKLRGKVDVKQEIESILLSLEEQKSDQNAGFFDIFKDKYLSRALIVNVGLVFTLQFSGINPILAFMETIFNESDSKMSPYLTTNLAGGIQVFGTFITMAVVEKLRRKQQLLISTSSVFVVHLISTVYFYLKDSKAFNLDTFSWLPLLCLMLYMFTFNLGLSTLPFTIMSEIFPHNVKASAASVVTCSCFAFSFIITLTFRIVLNKYGLAACFLLLSVSVFVMLIFIYILVPETKGKSVTEIKKIVLRR